MEVLAVHPDPSGGMASSADNVRVLLVADAAAVASTIVDDLRLDRRVTRLTRVLDPDAAVAELRKGRADLVVIAHPLSPGDAFRVAHSVKAETQSVRVAIVAENAAAEVLLAALVCDVDMVVPLARVRTLIDSLAGGAQALRKQLPREEVARVLDRLAVSDAALLLMILKGQSLAEAAFRLEVEPGDAEASADRILQALTRAGDAVAISIGPTRTSNRWPTVSRALR